MKDDRVAVANEQRRDDDGSPLVGDPDVTQTRSIEDLVDYPASWLPRSASLLKSVLEVISRPLESS